MSSFFREFIRFLFAAAKYFDSYASCILFNYVLLLNHERKYAYEDKYQQTKGGKNNNSFVLAAYAHISLLCNQADLKGKTLCIQNSDYMAFLGI